MGHIRVNQEWETRKGLGDSIEYMRGKGQSKDQEGGKRSKLYGKN
jgi:hypothetical protein